jgi:DNA-directed RNA polymerase specialized sigma24 family protein
LIGPMGFSRPRPEMPTVMRPESHVWMSPVLSEALRRLTAEERSALLLRDVEQRPLDAVATQLGCTEEAARLHLAHGRIKLLKYFETS